MDQAQAWDELPQVRPGNTETAGDWNEAAYWEDPGEADAREFAAAFLATLPATIFTELRAEMLEATAGNPMKILLYAP